MAAEEAILAQAEAWDLIEVVHDDLEHVVGPAENDDFSARDEGLHDEAVIDDDLFDEAAIDDDLFDEAAIEDDLFDEAAIEASSEAVEAPPSDHEDELFEDVMLDDDFDDERHEGESSASYTLYDVAAEGRAPTQSLPLVVQLIRRVKALHADGCLLGNLHPSAVTLDEKDVVDPVAVGPTDEASVYTSPEVLAGQAPSPAADVYSLGAIAYLLATGDEPPAGPERWDAMDELGGWFPAMERIVASCWDDEPARRPTLDALEADLSRAVLYFSRRRDEAPASQQLPALNADSAKSKRKSKSKSKSKSKKSKQSARLDVGATAAGWKAMVGGGTLLAAAWLISFLVGTDPVFTKLLMGLAVAASALVGLGVPLGPKPRRLLRVGAVLSAAGLSSLVHPGTAARWGDARRLSGADTEAAVAQMQKLQDQGFVELHGVNLHEADLAGARLSGVALVDADLRKANLRGADLGGAYLGNCLLQGAQLQGANLAFVDLSGTQGFEAIQCDDATVMPSGWRCGEDHHPSRAPIPR